MKRESKLLILILILAFVIHLSYLHNGFTWLDHGDIEGKRSILSVSQLPRALSAGFGETNFYRPLVTILNSLDAAIYQNNAWGFHLTNLLLLVLLVCSTYFFSRDFFDLAKNESLLVALVSGLHPLTILPVGAISYRQELIVVTFTFLTFSAYKKFSDTAGIGWIIATAFFWLLALFSKESALFWIPALILVWEWSRGRKWKELNFKDYLFLSAVVISYFILRQTAVPQFWPKQVINLSFSDSLGTRLAVLLLRLAELISPFKPSFSDATKIVGLVSRPGMLSLGLIITGLVLIFKSGKKSLLTRLILFIFIALLPSLSIIPLPRFSSPHYGLLALPAAGAAVILIQRQIKTGLTRKIFVSAVGLWLVIMSVTTFRAGFQFKNDYSLFYPEVIKDNNFREGHFYLGDYFLRKSDYQAAEKHLEEALQTDPHIIAFVDRNAALTNLAGIYLVQKKYDQAEKILVELIRHSSGRARLLALYNLAVVRERKGDYQGIVKLLKDTIGQWSQTQPIILYLKALVKSGNLNEAVTILKDRLNVRDGFKQQEIIQSILQ